jgi:hypothetical protein
MGVDHGGLEEFVAEQFLNCPDIISVLQKMCGKAVPHCVHRGLFGTKLRTIMPMIKSIFNNKSAIIR